MNENERYLKELITVVAALVTFLLGGTALITIYIAVNFTGNVAIVSGSNNHVYQSTVINHFAEPSTSETVTETEQHEEEVSEEEPEEAVEVSENNSCSCEDEETSEVVSEEQPE